MKITARGWRDRQGAGLQNQYIQVRILFPSPTILERNVMVTYMALDHEIVGSNPTAPAKVGGVTEWIKVAVLKTVVLS